jgi:hypothetical protein
MGHKMGKYSPYILYTSVLYIATFFLTGMDSIYTNKSGGIVASLDIDSMPGR